MSHEHKICVVMSDNRKLCRSFDESQYHTQVAVINYNYCIKHGYVFVYLRPYYKNKEITDIFNCIDPNTNEKRHASWSKLLSIKRIFNTGKYSHVVYIDSDCIFKDHMRSLDYLIDNMKDSHILFFNNTPWGDDKPCGGFFIIKNNKTAHTYLDEWYNFKIPLKNKHHAWEQDALWELFEKWNYVLIKEPMFIETEKQFLRHICHLENDKRKHYFKTFIQINKFDFDINSISYIEYDTNEYTLKFNIIVITCSPVRKAYLEKQLRDLNINIPTQYFNGWTPDKCPEYLPKDISIDTQRHICCTRSHVYALEMASNSDYEFSIIMEDDAAIHKTQFINSINEIILNWDKHVFPDNMVSIGWVPGKHYAKYLENTSRGTLKCILGSRLMNNFFAWGTQAYIVRNKDIVKFIPILKQPTFDDFCKSVRKQKYTFITDEDKLTNVDRTLNKILQATILFPQVVVESRAPSTIASTEHLMWEAFFLGYEDLKDDYYGLTTVDFQI